MQRTITLLTEKRYLTDEPNNWYVNNIFEDDRLLTNALTKKGFNLLRTNWDNSEHDWGKSDLALFRTTWDYFDRFAEFELWLKDVNRKTTLINSAQLINWNIDKSYLFELQNKGVHIPPSLLIKKGDRRTLTKILQDSGFKKAVIKPSISGAARHTYIIDINNVAALEAIFQKLILEESFLIQEFQNSIPINGEVSMMVFGGVFSHAVLKKAKLGDFRVQDDFGGTVHDYSPSKNEIDFAINVVQKIDPVPLYARVDFFWDNNGHEALGELELIEPELWFRKKPESAELLASAIAKQYL